MTPGSSTNAIAPLRNVLTSRLFVTRGLIAFFMFASFGTLWSGMALPLSDDPWLLTETQIGLLSIAGLAGALGAIRAGRWADRGWAGRATGMALILLVLSWVAIGQLPWSIVLLALGLVILDFAIQAAHVSNQHLLTAAHPSRASSVIGLYMVFYSTGSAIGAAGTTLAYAMGGWSASSMLGAAFAGCALVVWGLDRCTSNRGQEHQDDRVGWGVTR